MTNLKKKVHSRDIATRYGDDPDLKHRMQNRVRMLESWGDGEQATVDTLEQAETNYKRMKSAPKKNGLRK